MAFLMLVILGFCSMLQNADEITLEKPMLTGPSIDILDSVVVFFCNLDQAENLSITYRLFKENNLIGEYSALSGEPATFYFVVRYKHDGKYKCKVSGHNDSEIVPNYSDCHEFRVLVPVNGAQILSWPSSEDLWEGDSLMLQCNITKGTYVSYDWLLNDRPVRMSYNRSQDHLNIQHLTIHDSGNYTCVASNQFNDTHIYNSIDVKTVHVKVPVNGAQILSWPSSEDLWEGDSLMLQCNITEGTYVSYDWLLNDRPVRMSYSRSQNHLNIQHLTIHDSGNYTCVASNQFNDTHIYNSTDVKTVHVKAHISELTKTVHVKAHLSELIISFAIVKDENGSLSANVACQLLRGTPPVMFKLLRNNSSVEEKFSKDLQASFIVPVVLDQDMGTVQCQADDGRQRQSRQLNLTVESVGGAVTMTLERAVNQDFLVVGVWLQCRVERGTFPHYSWFLNNNRLDGKGDFYKKFRDDNSGLAVSLSPRSSGFYHCEATNSFNNIARLCSPKTLISEEALNKVPLAVTVIVFTCFSLVIFAVLGCCICGVVLGKKQSGKYILKHYLTNVCDEAGDAEDEENKYEDYYLEVEVYVEDMDVVQASGFEEPNTCEEEEEMNEYNGTNTE